MKELIEGRDYEVIDEGLGSIGDYLERTSRNAFLRFAGLIDSATSGRRGKYATIALNMAGVTTSAEGLSSHYERHAEIIDQYFEYVDVVALSKKLDVDKSVASQTQSAALKVGGLLTAGILIGVAGLNLYNRKK